MDVNVLPLLQPEEEILDDALVADDFGETGGSVSDGEETTGAGRFVVLHDRLFVCESAGLLGRRTLLLDRLALGRTLGIAGSDHLEKAILVDDFDILVDCSAVLASLSDGSTILHFKTCNEIGCFTADGTPDDSEMRHGLNEYPPYFVMSSVISSRVRLSFSPVSTKTTPARQSGFPSGIGLLPC